MGGKIRLIQGSLSNSFSKTECLRTQSSELKNAITKSKFKEERGKGEPGGGGLLPLVWEQGR